MMDFSFLKKILERAAEKNPDCNYVSMAISRSMISKEMEEWANLNSYEILDFSPDLDGSHMVIIKRMKDIEIDIGAGGE
jgi:hypothetical protein